MIWKLKMPFFAAAAAIRVLWYRLRGYEILAAPKDQAARIILCAGCLFRVGDQCGKCGCFIKAKTALNPEVCPVGKWSKIVVARQPQN